MLDAEQTSRKAQAVEELMHHERRWALSNFTRYGLQKDDAEDLTQEAAVQALTSRSELRAGAPAQVKGWFRSIAAHLLGDFFRQSRQKQAREVLHHESDEEMPMDRRGYLEADPEDSSPERLLFRKEQCALTRRILDSLPANHRVLLTLFYFQQAKLKEISELLGIRADTLGVQLHRARHAFRRRYEAEIEAEALMETRQEGKPDPDGMSAKPRKSERG